MGFYSIPALMSMVCKISRGFTSFEKVCALVVLAYMVKIRKFDMCNQPSNDCLHELEAIETNMLMFLGNGRIRILTIGQRY